MLINKDVIARMAGLSTSRITAIAKLLGLTPVRRGMYAVEDALQITLVINLKETRGHRGKKRNPPTWVPN